MFDSKYYRNKPKTDNSSALEKKKILQKQFLESTKIKTTDEVDGDKVDNSYIKEIEMLKSTIKNLKKENKSQKNKNSDILKELNRIKNLKNKDKDKIDDYYNKILSLEKILGTNNEEIKNLKYDNKQLTIKCDELIMIQEELNTGNKMLKRKVEAQSIKIKNQLEVIKKYSERIENQSGKLNELGNVYKNKKIIYTNMTEKYNEFLKEYNILKDEYYLLCEELEQRPIRVVTKEINTPYKVFAKKYDKIEKPEEHKQVISESLGTIINYSGFYIFESINDKQYIIDMNDISSNGKRISSFVGYPCKAIIIDNIAVIDEIYSMDEYINIKNKDVLKDNFKTERLRRNKILEGEDTDYSVLIVGSRNKDVYISEVRHMGIKDVKWFDPYSESLLRLKYAINKYDIVICCLSHVSHSASEIVKRIAGEDEIKFQFMTKDTSARLKARIRYAIANLK